MEIAKSLADYLEEYFFAVFKANLGLSYVTGFNWNNVGDEIKNPGLDN